MNFVKSYSVRKIEKIINVARGIFKIIFTGYRDWPLDFFGHWKGF